MTPRIVDQLRDWAQRLCQVTTTSRGELERVVGANVLGSPPDGIAELDIDDREVGLGGIEVAFVPGAVSRSELELVFGAGQLLPRLGHHPIRREYRVELAGAPCRCSLFVEFGDDESDPRVYGAKLRVDRAILP